MMAAVAIKRLEHSASALRQEAARTADAAQARRLLALALVLEGMDRERAAEICGMDRQTLRDWVHRYNAEGIAGLRDRPTPGRPPQLSPAQEAELSRLVEQGPDPMRDGVVRWRRVDLQAVIEQRFGIRLHERTVGKILVKLGFRRLSPRPHHPQVDLEAQAAFKKTLPRW
jgi:transposase